MNDWWKLCVHGEVKWHLIDGLIANGSCPGGSPVTAADLEGLGHKAWWCDVREGLTIVNPPWCHNGIEPNKGHEVCGYHLLIPIPEVQEVEA